MKKKMPGWKISLLGLLGSGAFLLLVFLFYAIVDREPGDFGTLLLIVGLLIHFVFQIALVVCLVRMLIRRAQGDHTPPPVRAYQPVDSGVRVDDRPVDGGRSVYTYNRDESFRFQENAAPMSWGAVCLLLVLIFPVGFYFLIVKTLMEKGRHYRNGSVLLVVGALMLVPSLGFVLLIVFTGADSRKALLAVIAMPCLLAAAGLCFVIYGAWLRARGKREDLFRSLITVERVTGLDTLAQRAGTDYAGAVNVVAWLLDAGLLGNAYLSYNDREVIVPGISERIVRRCPSCGGTTVLFANDRPICDYCGGAL